WQVLDRTPILAAQRLPFAFGAMPVAARVSAASTQSFKCERSALHLFLGLGEEGRIAAHRRRVDAHHLFGGEAAQIGGSAGFRPGAGEPGTAKRLAADDRADHAAIDVDIAVREPLRDMRCPRLDTRMHAESEAVAVRGDGVEECVERVGAPAYDMQNWSEHLFGELAGA